MAYLLDHLRFILSAGRLCRGNLPYFAALLDLEAGVPALFGSSSNHGRPQRVCWLRGPILRLDQRKTRHGILAELDGRRGRGKAVGMNENDIVAGLSFARVHFSLKL